MSEKIITNLKIVTAGNVDDGKSTLIGRLLYETKTINSKKIKEIEKSCIARSLNFEWSFLLDAMQKERDQAITIDGAYAYIKTKQGTINFIDAPGHVEFIKNMINSAAGADYGLLIIDAGKGITAQTKLHCYILNFLNIKKIGVIINKMDLINYSEEIFTNIKQQIYDYANEIQLDIINCIPVVALDGDNLLEKSENLSWCQEGTVMQLLAEFKALQTNNNLKSTSKADINISGKFRMWVQDVYKFNNKRIIVGKVASGTVTVGDDIVFSPCHKQAKVKTIEIYNKNINSAIPGQAIGLTLEQDIFIERGQLISHTSALPVTANAIKLNIFWLAKSALVVGDNYLLKLGTQQYEVAIEKIISDNNNTIINKNSAGQIIISSKQTIVFDQYDAGTVNSIVTGRVILSSANNTVALGTIIKDEQSILKLLSHNQNNIFCVSHKVLTQQRMARNGHKGAVFWLTGLSGSGKSTLAFELERILFNKGYQVYVLDGDNLRTGINANLGFSAQDRDENIRRVAETANLFKDAGFICLCALISPYKSQRANAKAIIGNNFSEIYVKADLEICEQRDPKGLYKQARKGIVDDFTGVSANYESPENPDLVIDTQNYTITESITTLTSYIDNKAIIKHSIAIN